jgi:hypothetical protein
MPISGKTVPATSEIAQAAEILSRLEAGFLPRPIFDQVARLAVMSVIELVPLRTAGGHTEVLLTQRDDDDPRWPSQWHNPGCVIRPTDTQKQDTFERLFGGELHGAKPAGLPVYVETLHMNVERGYNNAMVYWTELEHAPTGRWFDVRELPETYMELQRPVLDAAVAHYQRVRRETLG